MREIDWLRAACRDRTHSPEWWWPASSSDRMTTEYAKRVCHGCPLEEACLRHAVEQGETDGIWGGLTATEREPLIAAHRTRTGGVAA